MTAGSRAVEQRIRDAMWWSCRPSTGLHRDDGAMPAGHACMGCAVDVAKTMLTQVVMLIEERAARYNREAAPTTVAALLDVAADVRETLRNA